MSGPRDVDAAPARVLTVAAVAAAGRAVVVPFRLELRAAAVPGHSSSGAGEPIVLFCERVLRLLPGRRLVAQARLGAQPVLLKLFMGRASARHARREVAGYRLLEQVGVATARLLGAARADDGAGHALLFEFLADARMVDPGDVAGVAAAAALLARLHAAGCAHADLHVGNLLRAGGGDRALRLVDADGVRRAPCARWRAYGLGPRASMRNLALLCAQRPPESDAELAAIHRAYVDARGWQSVPDGCSIAALRAATVRARRRRVADYLRKTGRDCTEFRVERDLRATRICVREYWGPTLQRLLTDPEAAIRSGRMLKDGNTATIVRVAAGERTWIVKRYNVKGVWHAIRRALRPVSRWRNAWSHGQRLHFVGIPTARPVALCERRLGPLRGTAYLVMEDLGDRDLLRAVQEGDPGEGVLRAVAGLFRRLAALDLEHGDTKATNFLLRGEGVALIDLDSMRAHRRGSARGAARDRARFLANWDDRPALRERFAAALRGARADES